MLKEHLRPFWHSRNSTKLSDANSVMCCLKLFLTKDSFENPRENQVNGIYIQSPTMS